MKTNYVKYIDLARFSNSEYTHVSILRTKTGKVYSVKLSPWRKEVLLKYMWGVS